jgi:chromosome segregation ATPase
MSNVDRFENPSGRPFKANPIELSAGLFRFPGAPPSTTRSGCGAALDLVYQAAEVIHGIENHANAAEKDFANALQTLQLAETRIEELEKELQSAQACIGEARVTIKESNEALKSERSRLEAAERKMCQIEMRARTAEAQAKENANAVSRIEEAIRSQILAKRPPRK